MPCQDTCVMTPRVCERQVWNKLLRNEPPGETIIHKQTGGRTRYVQERGCPVVGGEESRSRGTAVTDSTLPVSKGAPPGSLLNIEHIIYTLLEIKQRTVYVAIQITLLAIPY